MMGHSVYHIIVLIYIILTDILMVFVVIISVVIIAAVMQTHKLSLSTTMSILQQSFGISIVFILK